MKMKLSEYKLGIEMIKKWEGFECKAYPDPASGGKPYTIGYGSTYDEKYKPIPPSLSITRERAEELLTFSLASDFIPAIEKLPYANEMTPEQKSALVSFAYNLGKGFYGAEGFETISRNLRNKDWDKVAKTLELYSMPWDKKVHQGLLNRRRDEGDLWNRGLQKIMSKNSVQYMVALGDTVLKKQPTQAAQLLEAEKVEVKKGRSFRILDVKESIDGHAKVVLDFEAGTWYVFNEHWKIADDIGKVEDSPPPHYVKVLKVRYFPQRDSRTAEGLRMCFSSSNAMLADWMKPGCLGNDLNADDYYLTNYVKRFGDTTDASAQIKALQALGIKAQFRQNLNQQDIIDQINRGIPVPVGYVHKGPVSAPRGGGHWLIIIGYDLKNKKWRVHDPYGEADLIYGDFVSGGSGYDVEYSFKNFNKRWMVEGPNTGWGIIASK